MLFLENVFVYSGVELGVDCQFGVWTEEARARKEDEEPVEGKGPEDGTARLFGWTFLFFGRTFTYDRFEWLWYSS